MSAHPRSSDLYAQLAAAPDLNIPAYAEMSPGVRAARHADHLLRARQYRRFAGDPGLPAFREEYLMYARNNIRAARNIRTAPDAKAERARIAAALEAEITAPLPEEFRRVA